MLALLLLLTVTQVPCAQGESSFVCHCKQGMVSACAVLEQTDPAKAADILTALRVLKAGEETSDGPDAASLGAQATTGTPEPPDCKGQQHHVISKRIAAALDTHRILKGLYQPRDPRFVTRGVDQPAHCGYQEWHRRVDEEVIKWLDDNPDATQKLFEEYLRLIYNRPAMRARFPRGF